MKQYGWALVLAACALVYANSLDGSFHYDDEHSIQNNINIRDLGNISAFFRDPGTFSVDPNKGMYRPLLLVTYAFNYARGGYEVFGYHLVNLLLHGLNACLVWWLAGLLSGRRDVALLAGLLFALHPLGSEPVNYISSRSESLAGLFFLLGLGLFIRGSRSAGMGRAVLSWIALALGLLSKSTVITLPAVLLVYDFLCISQRDFQRLKERCMGCHLPYWAISAGYLALVWFNGFLSGSVKSQVRDGWTQLLTQLKAFAYYLHLLLWPLRLNVEHQFAEQEGWFDGAVLGGLLLLLSCAGLLIHLYRRRRDLPVFLWLWGVLVLLPVMVMPLNVLVNERRLYLTCAAFCIGLALMLRNAWWRRWQVAGRDLGMWLSLLVLLAYGSITLTRNPVWKDDASLWGDAVVKAPFMPRVHLYLGNAYKDTAMTTADSTEQMTHWRVAVVEYQQAIELDPSGDLGLRSLNNFGAVHFKLSQKERDPAKKKHHRQAAENAYRQAVQANPQYADGLVNLGTIYHERGREAGRTEKGRKLLGQAIFYYQEALKIEPNHPLAYANVGLVHYDLGDLEQTRQAYDKAYSITPWNPYLLNNMANLYIDLAKQNPGEKGRNHLLKARRYYQQALRHNPVYALPKRGLKQVEAMLDSGYW